MAEGTSEWDTMERQNLRGPPTNQRLWHATHSLSLSYVTLQPRWDIT